MKKIKTLHTGKNVNCRLKKPTQGQTRCLLVPAFDRYPLAKFSVIKVVNISRKNTLKMDSDETRVSRGKTEDPAGTALDTGLQDNAVLE